MRSFAFAPTSIRTRIWVTATDPSSITRKPSGLSIADPAATWRCRPSCNSAALKADIGSSMAISAPSTPSARLDTVMPLKDSSLPSDFGLTTPFSITIQCASIWPVTKVSTSLDVVRAAGSFSQALPRSATVDRLVYFQSSCLVVGKPLSAKLASAASRTADNLSCGSADTAASSNSCCRSLTLMRWRPPAPSRSPFPRVASRGLYPPYAQSGRPTARVRNPVRHSRAGAGSASPARSNARGCASR